MNKPEQALDSYYNAIKIDERNDTAYKLCVKLLLKFEKYNEVIQLLEKIINNNLSNPELINNLAYAYYKTGNNDLAEYYYKVTIKIDHKNLSALSDLSLLLVELGKIEEVVHLLNQIIKYYPDNYQGWFNFAYCNEIKGNNDEAIENYKYCIKLNSNKTEAYFNLANLYEKIGNSEEAVKNYKIVIELDPCQSAAYINLGNIFYKQYKNEEAISILSQGLNHIQDADIYTNLGLVLLEDYRLDESLAMHIEACKLSPNDSYLHVNKSNTLFWRNNVNEAWKEYEWRFIDNEGKKIKNFFPVWQGEDLLGKKILVRSEQGIGDIVQYVRYIRALKAKGGKVIFECRVNLLNLFNEIDFIDEIITSEEIERTSADYEIFLLNIPGILSIDIFFYETKFPYLSVNKTLYDEIDRLLPKEQIRIGFAWRGNPKHMYDFKRSTRLNNFLQLFRKKKFVIYNLQYPYSLEEADIFIKEGIYNYGNFINTMEGTIALIANLDVIITVDTAIAHIAGALNKTVWLLLAKLPDWRWGKTSERTPLYPDVHIFRQNKPGNWEFVFERLQDSLNKLEEYQLMRVIFNKLEKATWYGTNGEVTKALDVYKDILELDPQNEPALLNYALLLQNEGKLEEAKSLYLNLLVVNPENGDALNNLSLIYREETEFIIASEYVNRALKIQPENLTFLNNRVLIEEFFNDRDFIENLYLDIIKKNPDNYQGLINYSSFLMSNNRYEEALNNVNAVLSINSDNADAHLNKSMIFLNQGNFEEGFKEYEWRRKQKTFPAICYPGKELISKDIIGKRILIFDEQGFGDSFLFTRYIPLLKKTGCYIIFQTRKELIDLYKYCLPVDKITTFDDGLVNINQFDYYIPLGSLPLYFSTTQNTIPDNFPYLFVDSADSISSVKLGNNKTNIGFFWKGRKPANNFQRACSLDDFNLLLEFRNKYNFVCLQKDGINNDELETLNKYEIKNNSSSLTDFFETAKIITKLDIVIGIDSAVINLAGAMGKPSLLLLSKKADWRWNIKKGKCLWYPSVKIFRQTKQNSWFEPINEIYKYLSDLT